MSAFTGYGLCLVTAIILVVQRTDGQGDEKSVAGCGDFQQMVRLECSGGGKIQLISRMVASHKENCMASGGQLFCSVSLPSANLFYRNVTAECQGQQSCVIRLQQVIAGGICPGFPEVNIWRNFLRIDYICQPSDVSQPTTDPTATQPTTTDSTATQPTTTDPTTTQLTTTDPTTTQPTSSVSKDNSQALASAMISMSVIIALVLLVILLAIGYRKRKLPPPVQERMYIAGTVIRQKVQTLVKRKEKKKAAPVFKARLQTNIQISRIDVEEEIYSNIDEMDNRNKSYEDWSPVEEDGERQLPRILVVPTSKPVSLAANLPNDYSEDPTEDELGDWSDSEFDSSSDEKEEKPEPPAYSDIKPEYHNSPRCTHSYAVLEKDASFSCVCLKPAQEQTNPNVSDQHVYCTPQIVTHTEPSEQSCYYSSTPLSNGKLVISGTGANPSFQDDSDYYSSAAPYMGESST